EADAGGWHDEPQSTESDLSVTASCIVALRACQGAGLVVPKLAVDRAAGYVLRCYRQEQKGFASQPGGDVSPGTTGAALLSLYMLGIVDDATIAPAAKSLVDQGVSESAKYYYLSTYYITHAAFQAGQTTWPAVWKRTCEQLLPAQRADDGSWPVRNGGSAEEKKGSVYATEMAVLTLAMPLRLLPIYQR